MASAEPIARAQAVRLQGRSDPGLVVRADGRELSRALTNLVVNALRHTPPDGAVSVSARREGRAVVIAVIDQCGGISEAHLERMFEPGWSGSEARSPGEGAGLGLAVVSGVMAAHAGEVSVRNTDDGCSFELSLTARP